MRQLCFWLIPLLLTQTLSLEVDHLPRKSNIVSNYLNKMLNSVFTYLNTSRIHIPEINLGETTGKFTQVEISTPGEMQKFVDGVPSFGFELKMNVTKLLITGKYDLVPSDEPGLIPIFGKGKFKMSMDDINLNINLKASYVFAEEKFDIDIPVFEILVQNSTVDFENLMNDLHLTNFLNELLSKLIPDLIKALTKPLIDMAMPLIDYYGNGIIKCIKMYYITNQVGECIRKFFLGETKTTILNELKPVIDLRKHINFQNMNVIFNAN